MADEPEDEQSTPTRIAYPAAFLSFEEPIGRVVGDKVFMSEPFLRLMESFFLRTGGETDIIKEVSDDTQVVKEAATNLAAGQDALDEAVEAAQAAAATADEKAGEAKADAAQVNDAVTDINTVTIPALDARITALEP